jgi:hypothetical protein
VTTYILQGWE